MRTGVRWCGWEGWWCMYRWVVWWCRAMSHEDRRSVVRVGGLVVHSIGQLLAYQIHSGHFNTRDYIYPVQLYSNINSVYYA